MPSCAGASYEVLAARRNKARSLAASFAADDSTATTLRVEQHVEDEEAPSSHRLLLPPSRTPTVLLLPTAITISIGPSEAIVIERVSERASEGVSE